jgi:protein SCO1/2
MRGEPNNIAMALRLFCVCLAVMAFAFSKSQSSWAGSGPSKDLKHVRAPSAQATYRGGLVTPPLRKPTFILSDTSGAAFDFFPQTDGYVTLLLFGYTRCPDACPTHMAAIAMALRQMPAKAQDQVKVVFVTVDPARDSAAVLRAWLDQFDRRFIGLTGSKAAIAAAQRASNIPIATKTALAGKDYAVGHAAFVLAYTKDNLAHVIYPSGVSPSDWTNDLPMLLNEVWSSY